MKTVVKNSKFHLSEDFLTIDIKDLHINVEYVLYDDNVVMIMDLKIPPPIFPYIKDNRKLYEAIIKHINS